MLDLCLPTSTLSRYPGRKPNGAKLALKPRACLGRPDAIAGGA